MLFFLLRAAVTSRRIFFFIFVLFSFDEIKTDQGSVVHKYSTRVVVTKYGPLRGVIIQRHFNQPPIEAFLGVPYATPPLGSLRYMPPVTPSMWKSTRLADSFSPVCPQNLPEIGNRTDALLKLPRGRLLYLEKLLPLLTNQSEDCLYMNIYVPKGVWKTTKQREKKNFFFSLSLFPFFFFFEIQKGFIVPKKKKKKFM
ncbi:neuroligin, putative [Pediculus humanus corporis]|uniref:Neuroligin, putative n=1 Tax=Pediculus humanus subsp. corporis TaxID=121224 RepID=E0VC36_PEDHC|nr:neuroligin, putative [Pediculus humanus corporis]EEB10942.1 neuroligin, putative [Pediculus humanus corporis]